MEKKNNCVRVGFSTILLTVTAILLCAAPCSAAYVVVDGTNSPYVLKTEVADYIDVAGTDPIYFPNGPGTLQIMPGGYASQGVYVNTGGTIEIYGSHTWAAGDTDVCIASSANVNLFTDSTGSIVLDTAYGPDATLDGTTITVDPTNGWTGKLTWAYEGTPYSLNISTLSNITIEIVGGGDSITVNIEKAKVSWHHSDIRVYGKLYLPQGFWMDNLEPVGSAVIKLAGIEVVDPDKSVVFELKGKDGKKWEYKDKENIDGPIKEFKIDWKGAKFDYKGDEGLHIHTHHIGGTETTLCIHCDQISGAFTVSVNETTIAYDEDRIITTDVEYDPQKDDNTHVHFALPFQLSPDMTIEVSGAVELSIAVADYYQEGFVKFKLVSIFDPELFPEGSESLPDELECVISLGDMISGNDLIDAWTKKDDKRWEYK